tara:strand:+ start:1001 stop:1537 length:537 start_codon:yes stop_codon:yes gene_type:complete
VNWLLLLTLCASTNDPYHLKDSSKFKHVKSIIQYGESHGQDSYELVAMAIVESRLKPRVVSSAGAIGLFQVMCRYWYKPLKYPTIKKCNKALFNPKINIKAGVYVLTTFRKKYKQCKGDLAYRCYYAGAGWIRRKGRVAQQIERYEKKVRTTRRQLHIYYSDLIEDIRSSINKRSDDR